MYGSMFGLPAAKPLTIGHAVGLKANTIGETTTVRTTDGIPGVLGNKGTWPFTFREQGIFLNNF